MDHNHCSNNPEALSDAIPPPHSTTETFRLNSNQGNNSPPTHGESKREDTYDGTNICFVRGSKELDVLGKQTNNNKRGTVVDNHVSLLLSCVQNDGKQGRGFRQPPK
eukprot:scaffold772_cov339-Pavlova_lutheri.AAC.77